MTGELQPGVLYTIGEFAEELGVSATPVREAVGDLAQLGLVEVKRNRGFIIPSLTDHDLDEIFQIRVMLEPPALMEVAGRLPQPSADECRGLVLDCAEAARIGDLRSFLDIDRTFHLRLIAPLGNRRLSEILARLRDETRLYGLRDLAILGALAGAAVEHEAILDAIITGDAEAVRAQTLAHIRHTRGIWAGLEESQRRVATGVKIATPRRRFREADAEE